MNTIIPRAGIGHAPMRPARPYRHEGGIVVPVGLIRLALHLDFRQLMYADPDSRKTCCAAIEQLLGFGRSVGGDLITPTALWEANS